MFLQGNLGEKFSGTTDAEGRLDVNALSPGEYTVEAKGDDDFSMGKFSLIVVAGQVIFKEYEVAGRVSPVRFKVLDSLTKKTISDAACFIESYPSSALRNSDETGGIEIIVGDGDYNVICEKAGFNRTIVPLKVTNADVEHYRSNPDNNFKDIGNIELSVVKREAVVFAMSLQREEGSLGQLGDLVSITDATVQSAPAIPGLTYQEDPTVPGKYTVVGIPIDVDYIFKLCSA